MWTEKDLDMIQLIKTITQENFIWFSMRFLCLLCPIILVSLFQQITKKDGQADNFLLVEQVSFFLKKEDLGGNYQYLIIIIDNSG